MMLIKSRTEEARVAISDGGERLGVVVYAVIGRRVERRGLVK